MADVSLDHAAVATTGAGLCPGDERDRIFSNLRHDSGDDARWSRHVDPHDPLVYLSRGVCQHADGLCFRDVYGALFGIGAGHVGADASAALGTIGFELSCREEILETNSCGSMVGLCGPCHPDDYLDRTALDRLEDGAKRPDGVAHERRVSSAAGDNPLQFSAGARFRGP